MGIPAVRLKNSARPVVPPVISWLGTINTVTARAYNRFPNTIIASFPAALIHFFCISLLLFHSTIVKFPIKKRQKLCRLFSAFSCRSIGVKGPRLSLIISCPVLYSRRPRLETSVPGSRFMVAPGRVDVKQRLIIQDTKSCNDQPCQNTESRFLNVSAAYHKYPCK